jgi:hypothetical protein
VPLVSLSLVDRLHACLRVVSFAGHEPSSLGLSLNRSQYGGCSTKYNTPAVT